MLTLFSFILSVIVVLFTFFLLPVTSQQRGSQINGVEASVRAEKQSRDFVRLNETQKRAILQLHNDYRSQADPPAANMRLMTWNVELEKSAQEWADTCPSGHGFPQWVKKDSLGQNYYSGYDRDGLRATMLWYNEKPDYDFHEKKCRSGDGIQCGHFTQIMWGTTYLLGCGIANCPNGIIFVCNYKPPGNIPGRKLYVVGLPCSQCLLQQRGFCSNGLCATSEECKKPQTDCMCPLKCHNCGVLNKKSCTCHCKIGWDSLDCSKPCFNANQLCRVNGGFPNEQSCSDSLINNTYCREMCGHCKFVPLKHPLPFFHPNITGERGQSVRNICCGGIVCPIGYVLDENFCECKRLCPGPLCNAAHRLFYGDEDMKILLLGLFPLLTSYQTIK